MIELYDEEDYLPPRRRSTLMWPRVDDEEIDEIELDDEEEEVDYGDLDFIRRFPPLEE